MEIKPTCKAPNNGRNVRQLREIVGVKQTTLAEKRDLSQSKISAYEQKEVIEDDMLEKIAEALGVV